MAQIQGIPTGATTGGAVRQMLLFSALGLAVLLSSPTQVTTISATDSFIAARDLLPRALIAQEPGRVEDPRGADAAALQLSSFALLGTSLFGLGWVHRRSERRGREAMVPHRRLPALGRATWRGERSTSNQSDRGL